MSASAEPRTAGRVNGDAKTGEYVSYSDMANLPATSLVVGTHTSRWGTDYLIANENGSIRRTDLAQYGWVFVESPSWDLELVSIAMVDGNVHPVPARIADDFRGLDERRNVVIKAWESSDGTEYLIPLTRCCLASGKGVEFGVACRSCHEEVDPYFGGPAVVVTARA